MNTAQGIAKKMCNGHHEYVYKNFFSFFFFKIFEEGLSLTLIFKMLNSSVHMYLVVLLPYSVVLILETYISPCDALLFGSCF